MNKRQVKNITQILLNSGASPEQIEVIDAEAALAGAMEIHGTVIATERECGNVDICNLSSLSDAHHFVSMNLGADCRVSGWVATASSDLAESIESESGETVTCFTKRGRSHLIACMRSLAKAVQTLPEAAIYA